MDPIASGYKRGDYTRVATRNYGSVAFDGFSWKDNVCVSPTWCTNDFEFFVAETETGKNYSVGLGPKIDGILGMARPIVPSGFDYTLGPILQFSPRP